MPSAPPGLLIPVTADLGGVTFYSCIKCETIIYKEKGWAKI